MRLAFFIEGRPSTKGSPHIAGKVGGKRWLAPDSRALERWMKTVKAAVAEHRPRRPYEGPVSLGLRFVLRRPQKHYIGKTGAVRQDAPLYPITRPDLDKLARAVIDCLVPSRKEQKRGLTRVLLDDSQVVHFHELTKIYGAREGVWVSLVTPGEDAA